MFKLLREAQALEKLGDKAAFVKNVQEILGVDSVTAVLEAAPYEITPEDYQQWLPAIIDIGAERGININKKVEFMDLAHELLDNDPKLDAVGRDHATCRKIVSALWQMFKVNQAHGDVKTHVAGMVDKAREEEEAANGLVGGEGGFEQAFAVAKGVENEERVRRRNPYQPGTLRAMLWDEQHKGMEDEEFDDLDDLDAEAAPVDAEELPPEEVDTDSMSPDDLASHITGDEGAASEEDLDSRLGDLEARVADLEAGEAGEQEVDAEPEMDMPPADVEADPEIDMEKDGDDAEVVDIPMEDEEKVSVSDLFRKAITSPKEHMSAALKAVEDEGASAWTALNVPTNPHPKKTPAHNAWLKGFKNSAKAHLGIVDKPREVPSKHRGKKK